MINVSWENNYKNLKRFNQWPNEFIVSYVKRFIKNPKNKRSLDLGCGVGNNLKFLEKEKFNIFGVDSSRTAIKLSKKVVKKKFRDQVLHSDFTKLPFKNLFFDLIIDRMSITHNLEKDIDLTIKEVHRVMKKNSIFISFFHSEKHPHLKYGKKNGKVYKDFKKGDFFHSNIVYATNAKNLKKKFKRFKILHFIENTTSDVTNKKKIIMVNFIIVVKK